MAGYIGTAPVPQATQTRDNFTATAGQTSFATRGYTPGFLDVYLNGVHLDPTDYTATNGTDVVLDTGAAVDDVVSVVAFSTFETNEFVQASGGAYTGAVQGATDTDTTNTGNVTLDFTANQNFVLTLTGNVTLVNPTTETVGQSGFIVFIQDSTGGRTVSLGTDYETAGGAGLTLSSTASTTDVVPYIVAATGRILLGKPQLAFS